MILKFGYRDIQVLPMSDEEADTERCSGWYRDNIIKVQESLDPPEQARILIHEILHAVFESFNIRRKRYNEELICKTLDKPLAQVLRDNPHLLKILNDAWEGKSIFYMTLGEGGVARLSA